MSGQLTRAHDSTGSAGKESACNVGDLGSTPGLGRFPGEEKGYPLQYSHGPGADSTGSHWVGHDWATFTFIPPLGIAGTGLQYLIRSVANLAKNNVQRLAWAEISF